jgi:hypothetical protein
VPVLQVLAFLVLMVLHVLYAVALVAMAFAVVFLTAVLVMGGAWAVTHLLPLLLACVDCSGVTHETNITRTRFVYACDAGCSRQTE